MAWLNIAPNPPDDFVTGADATGLGVILGSADFAATAPVLLGAAVPVFGTDVAGPAAAAVGLNGSAGFAVVEVDAAAEAGLGFVSTLISVAFKSMIADGFLESVPVA